MDILTDASELENDKASQIPCEAPPTADTEIPREVPPAVDAVINVSIDNCGLEACLNIESPSNGGAAPTFESMNAALSDCGISYNINIEKLKEIEAAPIYSSDIPVASGIAPIDGIDGTASFRIKTEEKNLRPKENKNGTVNYHDLDMVENVIQGQVLCAITLPTEGTPGISVKGKELSQKKGRPVQSYLGKNTELNEAGTAILSKIKGQVEFDGRKINVNETFYIKENVDNSTGNIKVSSNLVVLGMVLPGFKIVADGNIVVKGTVEASTVNAKGSISLESGITGSKLYCDGDLKCRFIENCVIFVKGDINAEYIINSDIKCGKNIKIIGSMAKIIGGSCIAGQNIEAHTIGSVANVKTRLELGTDHTVIERQQELLAQVEELEKQIVKLKPLFTILSQLDAGDRLTPEKRQAFKNVSYSYDTYTKLQEEAKKELEEIAESIQKRGFGRIICQGTIYPYTKVVIGKATLPITNILSNTSLYYNEGNICTGTARG